MKPKVSIVLPCYNGAKMLGDAIESVINQTFINWELIVVNDCSTDNTLEVAQSYAKKDNRIRVLSNDKNSKLPATLNHGFREAIGEYWTWTSDDNLLMPNMLEEMVNYLDQHSDIGFVVSDYEQIDVDGNVISCNMIPDNIQEKLPLNNYVGASFMYRSSVARIAGEYREDLFLVEDYEYWLRLSGYTKMARLPQVLYRYRLHSQSLTSTRTKEIAERLVGVRLLYLEQTERFFANNKKSLSQFYTRIVDNLRGVSKVKYYMRFTKNLPLSFGLKYTFVHVPHLLLKKGYNK